MNPIENEELAEALTQLAETLCKIAHECDGIAARLNDSIEDEVISPENRVNSSNDLKEELTYKVILEMTEINERAGKQGYLYFPIQAKTIKDRIENQGNSRSVKLIRRDLKIYHNLNIITCVDKDKNGYIYELV